MSPKLQEESSGDDLGVNLSTLFAEYFEYKSGHLKQSSLKEFEHISAHITKLPTVSLDHDKEIIGWIEDNLTQGVAKRTLKQISACCNWAIRRGKITENPFAGASKAIRVSRPEKKINPFSDSERQLILEGFERQFPHYAPFVKFLFLTGCRPSEAIGLLPKHLYLAEGYLIFSEPIVDGVRESTTKTGEIRRFPVNAQLSELLDQVIKTLPELEQGEPLLFPTPAKKPINLSRFREKNWIPVLSSQGVVHRPLYNCRHTFITNCVRQGIPVPTISSWVGNSPAVLLKHYAGFVAAEVPEL